MEVQKRNRLLHLTLLTILVLLFFAFVSQRQYANELESYINAQDGILKNGKARDSALVEKTKEYSNVITKYISDCGITINNKLVAPEEIVSLINNSNKRIEILQDSINDLRLSIFHCKDTLKIQKFILNEIKKRYGIEYNIKYNNSGQRYILPNISRADSALALFPFYKNKIISIDSTGKINIRYEENKIK